MSPAKEKAVMKSISSVLQFEMDFTADGQILNAAEPKTPQEAIENLKRWGKDQVSYLSPGQSFDPPGLKKGLVRVHVLGPPRRRSALKDMNPGEGDSYDKHLTENALLAQRMANAMDINLNSKSSGFYRDGDNFPFNSAGNTMSKEELKQSAVGKLYRKKSQQWRKIDDEWLGEFEYLSLYLNTYTNNSSLVLAFELVKPGKVLLFAADAQMGNWKSWEFIKWEDESVATEKLLANTIVYKVGHHCSHNATYTQAFEKMNHPELVAMIPVDEANAKAQAWKMPASKLFRRIKEKTNGRVIRMDKPPKNNDPAFKTLPQGKKIRVTPLYIDYTLGGLE